MLLGHAKLRRGCGKVNLDHRWLDQLVFPPRKSAKNSCNPPIVHAIASASIGTGSAPEWPIGGDAKCFRAVARRAASVSRSKFRRNTGDADGTRPPALSPQPSPDRIGAGADATSRTAPTVVASRCVVDGQSGGPPENGTHCSEVRVQRGGPQSFAPEAPGSVAPGCDVPGAGLGCRDSSAQGSVSSGLRGAPRRAARLASGSELGRWYAYFAGPGWP